ncbi:sensor histidine kinase [Vibrio sp. WXL210]|uniref:sensor histidine kinase n=1 Tax=Vibrio sp. WXL210 TaxID=3450709 RepID=UPI003EC7866D
MFFSTRSLRFQLLVAATLSLCVVAIFALMGVKRYAYNAAQMTFDQRLSSAALQIIDHVHFNNLSFSVDIPFSAFKSLTDSPHDRVFYLVTTNDLQVVTGYEQLLDDPTVREQISQHKIRLEPQPDYFYLDFMGESVRFSLVSRAINTMQGQVSVYAVLGQTLQSRIDWEAEISSHALKMLLVVIVCSLLVITALIWQVLKPVNEINRKIAKRSNLDLTPISVDGPQEINHLIETINVFMAQLDGTLNNLKSFTSEAAHQLKTPIAGIKAQLDVAQDKVTDPEALTYIQKISHSNEHLERTVFQLLNHATIKHRYRRVEPVEINFNRLVKQCCRELAINALQRNIELHYDESVEFTLRGDEFALSQMLNNLIENAIKYSPKGGRVEVEVMVIGTKATLTIRDYGEGIADQDKPLVFERFYRSPNATAGGTGLGMSIALDVAEKTNGRLILLDTLPHGLTVQLQFPFSYWQEVKN